jgi:hypothetical protein
VGDAGVLVDIGLGELDDVAANPLGSTMVPLITAPEWLSSASNGVSCWFPPK